MLACLASPLRPCSGTAPCHLVVLTGGAPVFVQRRDVGRPRVTRPSAIPAAAVLGEWSPHGSSFSLS